MLWAACSCPALNFAQTCTAACSLLHFLLTQPSQECGDIALRHVPAIVLAVVRCSQAVLADPTVTPDGDDAGVESTPTPAGRSRLALRVGVCV